MKTKIYLIRHAESWANENGLYGGITDYPLSERGKDQALELAERLRNIEFGAIYSSPLSRAYDTIKPLAERQGKPILIEPDLTEIHVGEWEGIPWNELKQKYPKETTYITETQHHFGMKGGEPTDNVARRMAEVLRKIAQENLGKIVAVASHIQAIRAFICNIQNIPYEQINLKLGFMPNTGIVIIEYESTGKSFDIKPEYKSNPPKLAMSKSFTE